jgi:predicted protein tyrosine phosphatase
MNTFLFVCEECRLRSPTCEHVARSMGYSADSAGTAIDTAVRPLTLAAIERAEYVICMTPFQSRCVVSLAPHLLAPIVWDIPDIYDYCQPELMTIVRLRIADLMEPNR